MKMFFGVTSILLSIWICFGHAPELVYAEDKSTTETVGDVLHIALPVIAFGSTFFAGSPDGKRWDKEGTAQSLKGIGTAVVGTAIWKRVADKLRPNERSRTSFPSGHASFAFSGAGFIDTRYGHAWGIPSLLAATYVAYSRVYADAHFADDALAGSAVGLLSAWLFTTPQTESRNVALLPMVMEGGTGLQLIVTNGGSGSDDESKKKKTGFSDRAFRFEFGFGPAYLSKNEITAPSATGTTFDLDNFNKDEDPLTTAAEGFDFYIKDRHEVRLFLAPFESRDTGQFSSPVRFAGQLYPANTKILSAYRLYDLRGRWRYNLTPTSPWNIKLGAGLAYQDLEVDLATESGSVAGSARDQALLPFGHASVGYQITPKWSIGAEADGIYLSDDRMLDAVAFINYRISDRWDFTAGYQYYSRTVDQDEIKNNVVYNIPHLSIAYSWMKD